MVCAFILQVKDLQSQLKFKRTEVDDMLSAAQAKDRENSKLWEQVWSLRIACAVQHPRLPVLARQQVATPRNAGQHSLIPQYPLQRHTDQTRCAWPNCVLRSGHVVDGIGSTPSSAWQQCLCCTAVRPHAQVVGGKVLETCGAMHHAACAGALLLQRVSGGLQSSTAFACCGAAKLLWCTTVADDGHL